MATSIVKLQPVGRSPSTLQYKLLKKTPSGRPHYERRFYPNDEAKETLSQKWLARTDPMMPPYPYGKNHHFDEANHGLYGGKTIQAGNKISDGRNKGKTRRKWYPNVRVERLKSEALNVEMSIPTVARVSRTIRKCGGLDEYLLGEKPARIKELGLLGWKLRWLVMKSNAIKAKHAKERLQLGLPSTLNVDATFADTWADPEMQESLVQRMHAGWEELKEKDARFLKNWEHWKGSKNGVKKMMSLELYDPKDMRLPGYVQEAFQRLPEVKRGFGPSGGPGGEPGSTDLVVQGKTANKDPRDQSRSYDGGVNSAIKHQGNGVWDVESGSWRQPPPIPLPPIRLRYRPQQN